MNTEARGEQPGRTGFAPCVVLTVTLTLVASACGGSGPTRSVSLGTDPPNTSASSGADGGDALVTRVVDGDTIVVRFRGQDLTVRLIGIDTPESLAPDVPVQCYAKAASRFTERTLEGKPVRLEFDVERLDRYGRTLAYVWLGDELFNETLVRLGYAFVATYPPDVKHVETFVQAQRRARAHELGVWGRCVDPGSSDA